MNTCCGDTLIRFARFFACTRHEGQSYGGGLPYSHHLAAVEAVARRFDVTNPIFLAACWLHDVVEDTNTKSKEIRELFGEEVAALVEAVTNEPGSNRKVRHALTYPKTRSITNGVLLKLCDRIANVEAGGSLTKMYQKEYEDFRRALYTEGQHEELWFHLDTLMGWAP